ncbi:hypothetical protein LRAMOSA07652 [Lichtheimia ramosa]|uniref:F-box domain-containing protein n=1 Tax=Lichtheimia ramosa TaxID=688394 RepID=A0A077WDG5_9FUNG|nr:hypothetical protein LRAMOSA07652 [Lichtheimia ramosa]
MTCINPLCHFPSEINHVIFSYLNTPQIFKCLAVCRQWRDNIPAWIDKRDRSLVLDTKQLDNAPPSLQHIGRVVERVHLQPSGERVKFQQVNFQQVLDKLVALDLPLLDTLHFLPMPVEAFSMLAVSQSWHKLGTKLRRLGLQGKPSPHAQGAQVDLSVILDSCPFLTHLSFDFCCYPLQFPLDCLSQHQHEHLQYLNMDAHIQLQHLLPLVRHCPQLRYLRFSWDPSMKLDEIMDACPSLKGIGIHSDYIHHSRDPWWKDRSISMAETTLQELISRVRFGDQYRQTAFMIAKHCAHLRRIHLIIQDDHWEADMMQHYFSMPVYDPLLALEEFFYRAIGKVPVETSFVIPLLKQCPNLQRISLDAENADPIYRALVGHALPHLQSLSVWNTDRQMDGLEDLLFSIANTNAPLERFEFTGNFVRSHAIYQALAQISSLRHIVLRSSGGKLGKKCMTQCLSRLRGDGASTRNLESITFIEMEGFMTVEAFGSLRKILSLKRVTFIRCGLINERGLRLLIDRQPPLEFLEIHLSSKTRDGNPLEPILDYARSKIDRVEFHGP